MARSLFVKFKNTFHCVPVLLDTLEIHSSCAEKNRGLHHLERTLACHHLAVQIRNAEKLMIKLCVLVFQLTSEVHLAVALNALLILNVQIKCLALIRNAPILVRILAELKQTVRLLIIIRYAHALMDILAIRSLDAQESVSGFFI